MHHERGGDAPSYRSSCTTGAVSMHHPARRIHIRTVLGKEGISAAGEATMSVFRGNGKIKN